MNETVTKILLSEDNSYLRCIEVNLDSSTVLADHVLKIKKIKKKVLKKEDIHDILIKNWTRNHSCKIMI